MMKSLGQSTNNFTIKKTAKKAAILLVFLPFFHASLWAQQPNEKVLRKLTHSITDTTTSAINVYIFFSPECPICINMVSALNEIMLLYDKQDISFKMVYPGTYYSDERIIGFHNEYSIKMNAYKDDNFILAKQFNVQVVPTAIVLNRKGEKIYDGKINNRYESIGRRRTVVTEEYLSKAINAAIKEQLPSIQYTKAVGCFLNYK